jgi:hypothetical protein
VIRNIIVFILSFLIQADLFAQSSPGFTYQGVAIDQSQLPVKSKKISLRVSVLSESAIGNTVFTETHGPTTDAYGQFSINVGAGAVVNGNITQLQWDRTNYFLKIEADIIGGTNYTLIGVSQIYPVPYALNAYSAGSTLKKLDSLKSEASILKILKRNDSLLLNNATTGIYIQTVDSLSRLLDQVKKLQQKKLNYDSIITVLNKKIDSVGTLIQWQNTTSIKSATPPSTLKNGLIAYYPFNGNANDSSGNNNHGTVNGASLTKDRFGNDNNAYSFDGTNDYIKTTFNLLEKNTARSVSVWFKTSQLHTQVSYPGFPNDQMCLISYGSPQPGGMFDCSLNYNCEGVTLDINNGVFTRPAKTTDNIWHNLIFVSSGPSNQSVDIYYDGLKLNSSNYCLGPGTQNINTGNTLPMTIGSYANETSRFFKGMLDDIRIYNRSLDSNEVVNLYNLEKPSLTAGLVAYYPFNGNANDSSGNGIHGTVNGATPTTDRFGKSNSAYLFKNNYILIPNNKKFETKNYSVSFWASTVSSVRMNPLVKTIYQNANQEQFAFAFNFNNEGVTFSTKYGTECTPGIGWQNNGDVKKYNDGIFHQYTGTVDGNKIRFYVDGKLIKTIIGPNDSSSACFGGDIQVGRNWQIDDTYFDGKIDDIRIYNRALDSTEVVSLYNTEKPSSLTSGLVAYYPFNGNASDSSGNGLNGNVNGAQLTTDRFGKANAAYLFNGVTDKIVVPNSSKLSFQTENKMSLSYWVTIQSLDATKISFIVTKQTGSGDSQDGWNSGIETSKVITVRIQNGSGTPSSFLFSNSKDSISIGKTYHIVQVIDNGTILVYINGSLSSKVTGATGILGDNSSDMYIGMPTWSAGNAKGFNGIIDDIRIYNRPLDSSEVANLYNAEKPSNLTSGLVAYYPFNGNANDESGNSNNGIINGATLSSDRFGNANKSYYFSNSFIRMPNPGPLGTSQRTISFWSKTVSNYTGNGFIVSYGSNNSGGSEFGVRVDNLCGNAPNVDINLSTVSYKSSQPISNNEWHHYTVTYNPTDGPLVTNIKYYVDGNLVKTSCAASGTSQYQINTINEEPLTIGRWCDLTNTQGGGYFFNGNIDDIRIYNRALDSIEVNNLYNSEKPSLTSGLVAYYPFTGNANDSSGNGYNGVVSGATLAADRHGTPNAAYQFNGSSFISAAIAKLPIGVTDRTISFWAKQTAQSTNTIKSGSVFHYGNISTNNRFSCLYWPETPVTILQINDVCTICQNSVVVQDQATAINSWNQVVITVSNKRVICYVNGKKFYYGERTSMNTALTDFIIGKAVDSHEGGEYFRGLIDDIRIYSRSLDSLEIINLYNLEKPINLNAGLVAYYPFTGNANDSSGNNNNGVVTGATLTSDRFNSANSAYNFNGSSNYITVKNSSSISIQSKFSTSVWVLMDGGGCNPRVFEINENLNSCGGYVLAVNGTSNSNRTIHAAGFGSCTKATGFNPSNQISSLKWNHLAYTVDGVTGLGKFYINGELVQTVNGSPISNFSYNNNNLTIGNINSGRCDWWGGKIDDLRLYNRVLNDTEISYLSQH